MDAFEEEWPDIDKALETLQKKEKESLEQALQEAIQQQSALIKENAELRKKVVELESANEGLKKKAEGMSMDVLDQSHPKSALLMGTFRTPLNKSQRLIKTPQSSSWPLLASTSGQKTAHGCNCKKIACDQKYCGCVSGGQICTDNCFCRPEICQNRGKRPQKEDQGVEEKYLSGDIDCLRVHGWRIVERPLRYEGQLRNKWAKA